MAEGVWTETASFIEKVWSNSMFMPISAWSYDHPEVIFSIGGAMVLGGSAVLLRKNRQWYFKKLRRMFRLKRGKTMNRKEALQLERTRLNDAIVSGIEDAVADGRIKASTANTAYRRLSWFFKSNDFSPQKLPKEQKLSTEEYQLMMKMLFNRVTPNIPGTKPGEIDNVYVYGRNGKATVTNTGRKFGDKARRLSKP